jgi:GABA(A) receptor-associated protein
MNNFGEDHSINIRKQESQKIQLKYPTRVPIIVEKCKKSLLNDIDKKKYLVPKDMTMSQFIYIIRKRINLKASESLFVMVDHQLVQTNRPIGDVYDEHLNGDGFLYMIYTSENTFG